MGCGQLLGLSDYEASKSDETSGSGGTGGNGGAGGTGGEKGSTGGSGNTGGTGASGGAAGEAGAQAAGGSGGDNGSGGAGGGQGITGGSGGSGGSSGRGKEDGESCGDPGECASGFCVDGVCCDSACDGICERCDTSTAVGSCEPIAEGTDPDDECQDHVCDGGGNCATCDNAVMDGDETNVDCGGSCLACPGSLLITELVDTTNSQEFIEIHNPGSEAVTLEHVYLADFPEYYQWAVNVSEPSDFRVRFPAGASIDAGEYVVISMENGVDFAGNYGEYPDYDLDSDDATAPVMRGVSSGSTTLSNTGEMVVMFFWDGSSDLVSDIDYVVYEPTPFELSALDAMNKSGQTVGASTYANETPIQSQSIAPDPDTGESLSRCDLSEGSESQSGGNGFSGQDETSENLEETWVVTSVRTPGAPNDCN